MSSSKPTVYIVLGPTAVGKTDYAIHLAKQQNGEIISADSMQVYRGMNIGTNKPSFGARQGIPHHLIDIRNPEESWTVADFKKEAEYLITDIQNRGKLPILAGGTGYYLWVFLEGFDFPPLPQNPEVRERLRNEAQTNGDQHLYEKLKNCDPASAVKIHPHDTKRIIRALEVFEVSGKPQSAPNAATPARQKWDVHITGLTMSREKLYQKIDARVDEYMALGLVGEVRNLLAKGTNPNVPSMQALGYKEVVEYLHGNWSEEKMVTEIKKRTRHFAKRQYVWFRRFEGVEWLEVGV